MTGTYGSKTFTIDDVVLELHGRGGWVTRAAIDALRRSFTIETTALTRLVADDIQVLTFGTSGSTEPSHVLSAMGYPPAEARVREQDRLEHLVRSVGGEHHVGRHAVPLGDGGAAGVMQTGGRRRVADGEVVQEVAAAGAAGRAEG